jgi:hypothetical protein
MKMTPQHQDNILLRDILERNYYKSFKEGNDNCKNFNLSFFYINDYTNFKFIPGYESPEEKNDLSKILSKKIYEAEIFTDSVNANKIATDCKRELKNVRNTDTIKILMKSGGGFVIKLSPRNFWFF